MRRGARMVRFRSQFSGAIRVVSEFPKGVISNALRYVEARNALALSQNLSRIDARRATRWQPGSQCSDGAQSDGRPDERRRIVRFETVQK